MSAGIFQDICLWKYSRSSSGAFYKKLSKVSFGNSSRWSSWIVFQGILPVITSAIWQGWILPKICPAHLLENSSWYSTNYFCTNTTRHFPKQNFKIPSKLPPEFFLQRFLRSFILAFFFQKFLQKLLQHLFQKFFKGFHEKLCQKLSLFLLESQEFWYFFSLFLLSFVQIFRKVFR